MTMKKKFSILRHHLENVRWHFWAYVMDHFPRFYNWADKHLPINTLPF